MSSYPAAQLDAGVNRFIGGGEDFIGTVGIVTLVNKHEGVIYVDFDLLDKLNFKYNIIVDVLFFGILAFGEVLIQIDLHALVILKISIRQDLVAREIIQGGKYVFEPQDSTE